MNREEINKAYQELLIKVSKIEDIVKRHKFDYKLSFYNGHYYKDDDSTFHFENMLPLIATLILASCLCSILLRQVENSKATRKREIKR